jgi:hypothetical protein
VLHEERARQAEEHDVQILFETGRVADFLLVLLVVEAVAILFWHRLTGRGPSLRRAWPFLLAGACLLLAWRTAAGGLPWPVPAAFLAGAGAAHAVDLLRRRL